MKYIIVMIVIILSGCADSKEHRKADYREALMTHRCTAEQFKLVQSETLFCKEETSYYAPYCFATAIMRNCTPIAAAKPEEGK